MALIVEDGTGLADAESYISVLDADTYFAQRENSTWDTTAKDKEALLRRATDYMTQAYHTRWKGYRASATQALDWPRREVPMADDPAWFTFLPNAYVPLQVRRACAELALIVISQELNPVLERAQQSVTVGEISVTYQNSSPQAPRYPAIDALLAPLLRSSGMAHRIVRT